MEILIAADIRFPLERANGIQIVKTAAALAAGPDAATLVVRHSDPRPTPEVLRLYGVAATPLRVVRLRVGHRRGRVGWPRVSYLARAGRLAWAALRRGAAVLTRDLQLADLLLRLPRGPGRLVYEAHAVEAVLYAERGRLYGSGEQPRARKQRRIDTRERRVWRGADAFVATTAGIAASFAERHGPRDGVHVVPNGCDVAADRRFDAAPDVGPPAVVYAGQLYPWKGVDVLVRAMGDVPDGRLVVMGGLQGEPDLARIAALVAELGLAARVELRGTRPQAEVGEALRAARIVVAPFLESAMTRAHTSPIKLFEAMAAGRAIVATDLPSTREVLEHEVTALLVPPGDPAALAAAIRRLLSDRDLATRLARAAFDAAPRYSWARRAERLRDALRGAA